MKRPRPKLHEVPIPLIIEPGKVYMTIDVGAWDALIYAAYETGGTLIEIKNEQAVRAFRKP